jgi:hypothetical protein
VRPSKEFCKELCEKIQKLFPRSKGKWHYDSLVVRPFRKSQAEFLIGFDEDPCIIREDYGFDWDAKGSNTAIVYFPNDFQFSQDTFSTPDGVISFLMACIRKYIKDEQDFYDEGLDIEREWSSSEEEARKLAGIIYPKGFLKEIGVKEG